MIILLIVLASMIMAILIVALANWALDRINGK